MSSHCIRRLTLAATRHRHFFVLVAIVLSAAGQADAPDPDPARFAAPIEAFAEWDRKNAFPENAIVFVGSSSIRFWPTAAAFPGKPVINRGFGGSELSDVIHFYDDIVKPYAPAMVVVYAGDNDIAHDKSPEQVFEDYKALVALLQEDFPETVLVFISIKPSKRRWTLWPRMVEANRLIREYSDGQPNLHYADLATPLLGEDGQPLDVFVDDGLHLNERGYALWQRALRPYLD